jgi:putative heme-binding domain-containing protein
MPVMSELGPAVPSGLTRYASSTFGAEYRDNFFAAMFNLRKVTRHVLEPDGATFTARGSDFLVSSSRDFHPTDVLEDADGSLLVVDTGPWYKLCCPTSQLAKPDVPGAIYRVRRRGAPAARDARGLEIPWGSLTAAGVADLLDDRRPAVQSRALHHAGKLGAAAVPAVEAVLAGSRSAVARRNAVWALTRIADPAARAAVRRGLDDRDPTVRQAAIHSAGLWRDAAAGPRLARALQSGEPAIQRAAAEALGRTGGAGVVRDLLTVAAAPHDRVLEHSLIYALIEIGDAAATVAEGLQAAAPRARRAALIALDQMDNGGLQPAGVVPLLDSADPILSDTAWWIAGRHPEWGGALAPIFARRLADSTLSPAARDHLQQRLVQFGEHPEIQVLLGTTVERAATSGERLPALRAMALVMKGRVKTLPAAWTAPLVRALEDRDAEIARHAVAVARAVPAGGKLPPPMGTALVAVARDRSRALALRLEALAAAGDSLAGVDADLFELLRTGLGATQPVAVRAAAASVVEQATLDRGQLLSLAAALETAGPLELPRLLRAFDRGGDDELGEALLAGLGKPSARSSVRAEMLRPRLAKFPEPVRQKAEALLAAINVNSAQQSRRLDALLASVQGGGDVRRGQDVFNSTRGACASCHAIGYMGGTIGPDLTRIGQVRTDRDLLEAIVFPSVSFARGYEPVVVRTASGETHTGMLRAELPDEVVIATLTRDETRIARREIVDLQPASVSLMPAGLAEQLTTQELADLVAFLRAAR